MSTRVQILTHEIILEPPDTILILGNGIMDGNSAARLHDQMFEWVGQRPYMFLIADMSKVTTFSTDGRKQLVSSTTELPPRAVALCGAPFGVRVVFDMVGRARSLLGKQGRWMKLCADHDAARKWFNEMRPELEAFTRTSKSP